MSATYHNTATGNARVGVMAGHIDGNITVGGGQNQPTDPPAAIADLRGRIKDAHSRGRLDPATYAAAEAELDTARRSLSDKGTLLLALGRFRGLIADVAEIAVVVSAIITSLSHAGRGARVDRKGDRPWPQHRRGAVLPFAGPA